MTTNITLITNRGAKHNQLLWIEEELGTNGVYPGLGGVLNLFWETR